MTRRATTKTQLKPLIALTRNMCAMHDEEPPCNGFALVQNEQFLGEIAHIAAAEDGGKRWDDSMDDDQRNANPNLIVLCPNHHTLIDSDEDTYTTEYLLGLKAAHEGASTGAVFEPAEAAFDDAERRTNAGIRTGNVNSGDGTQVNAAQVMTAPNSVINLTAGNINLTMSPSSPSGSELSVTSMLPPAGGADQSLALQVDVRVISLPVLGQQASTVDTACYRITFNEKLYLIPQGILSEILAGAQLDAATGKFDISRTQVVTLLQNAVLFHGGRFGEASILDELRQLTSGGSLMVILECSDSNIRAIPFENLTAVDLGVAHYVVFALRQEGRL